MAATEGGFTTGFLWMGCCRGCLSFLAVPDFISLSLAGCDEDPGVSGLCLLSVGGAAVSENGTTLFLEPRGLSIAKSSYHSCGKG